MDFGMAMLFTSTYLYLVGLLLILPQNTTSAIVWGIVGLFLVVICNVTAFFTIKKWAAGARIKPEQLPEVPGYLNRFMQ